MRKLLWLPLALAGGLAGCVAYTPGVYEAGPQYRQYPEPVYGPIYGPNYGPYYAPPAVVVRPPPIVIRPPPIVGHPRYDGRRMWDRNGDGVPDRRTRDRDRDGVPDRRDRAPRDPRGR